jgi:hypothetical protein
LADQWLTSFDLFQVILAVRDVDFPVFPHTLIGSLADGIGSRFDFNLFLQTAPLE